MIFGRPFVRRLALCYQTVVCLYVCIVCNVGVLWRNGWMDQDETWLAGTPRPWSYCVACGMDPAPPPTKGQSVVSSFTLSVVSLSVDVSQFGHIVLHGEWAQLPLPQRAEPPILGPYLFWPNGWIDQDATW